MTDTPPQTAIQALRECAELCIVIRETVRIVAIRDGFWAGAKESDGKGIEQE